MRSPHHITAHHPPNPYEELGRLDDGPLDHFLTEDVLTEDTGLRPGEAEAQDDPWAPPDHRRNGRRRRRGRLTGAPLAL